MVAPAGNPSLILLTTFLQLRQHRRIK
jgi:hypothetical protein